MLVPSSSQCMSAVRTTALRSFSTRVVSPSTLRLPLTARNRPSCASYSSHLSPSRTMASAATAVKFVVAPPTVPAAEPWRCHFEEDPDTPRVFTFFEKVTSTWQYVLVDSKSSEAILIDTVLDYDPASGTISTTTADGILSFVRENSLTVKRIL